ncbi:unnamed protein product [Urochloa humidicola]
MDDERTKILSTPMVQSHEGCCYFAMNATLEPNVRVQWKKNVTLSTAHLEKLNEDSRRVLPNERGKIMRLISMVKDNGVYEEQQYKEIVKGELRESDARKYKIFRFTTYNVKNHEEIRTALHQLRRGGPLLAVLRISRNYHDCYNSGMIYRYDHSQRVERNGRPETHAVVVVSFVVEARVPYLECQDSRGEGFGRQGFLAVDLSSVKELYSFRVGLSRD